MRAKFEYEGMYAGKTGIVVCMRVETGGVPRFENMVIPYDLITRGESDDLSRAVRMVHERLITPPWADDTLPGID